MVDIITRGALDCDGDLYKLQSPYIPCLKCGMCCKGYLVRISLIEAKRIADGLGIAWRYFQNRYVTECWDGADSYYINQCDGVCVFLKPSGIRSTVCLVHSFKPSACLEWTPSLSRRQCKSGLVRYWGLTVDHTGELIGPEERLREFHSFLESLAAGGETDANLRVRV